MQNLISNNDTASTALSNLHTSQEDIALTRIFSLNIQGQAQRIIIDHNPQSKYQLVGSSSGIDATTHAQFRLKGVDPAAPNGRKPFPMEEDRQARLLLMQQNTDQQSTYLPIVRPWEVWNDTLLDIIMSFNCLWSGSRLPYLQISLYMSTFLLRCGIRSKRFSCHLVALIWFWWTKLKSASLN